MPISRVVIPYPIQANLIPLDVVKSVKGRIHNFGGSKDLSEDVYDLAPKYVVSNGENAGIWALSVLSTGHIVMATEVSVSEITPPDGMELIYGDPSDTGLGKKMAWKLETINKENQPNE